MAKPAVQVIQSTQGHVRRADLHWADQWADLLLLQLRRLTAPPGFLLLFFTSTPESVLWRSGEQPGFNKGAPDLSHSLGVARSGCF